MSSFFDVDVRDSQRSGLNIYDADSGFKDVGCNIVAVYKWSDKWSVRTSGGFTRLLNDAEDSPVVDDRGDGNQLHVGVMAIYVSGFSIQFSGFSACPPPAESGFRSGGF